MGAREATIADGVGVAGLVGLAGVTYWASVDGRAGDPAARKVVLEWTAGAALVSGAIFALSMSYGRYATAACERVDAGIWPPPRAATADRAGTP